jgi:cell division protein FtsQ
MYRKILIYGLYVLAACYLIFALVILPGKEDNSRCKGAFINIASCDDEILNRENVIELLGENGLDPNGKAMDSIVCRDIERFIQGLSVVEKCEAYKTTAGYVDINIECRTPILKVLERNGNEFYIDSAGNRITNLHKTLYVPVATGCITEEMIAADVKEIAKAISKSRFWSAQTEQIYFDENRNIIIVPRVGDHIIEFGTVDNAAGKLDKLYTFYKKGLSEIGWNKHSKLNVEFGNKVIATVRDKKNN